ncbi:MAG: methyltransferase domain-containing protein [Deltaproteobacteria bacterium]|nr:methyltransferase domain-containing protein [Deltaproteobacteria bacterium]
MQHCSYASSLCHDRYAECFEAYKRISTEWECMRQWIHDNLLDSLPHKENISILSVGSGSGDFDFQLIKLVASKFKSVDYVAVEPNKVHSQQFKIRTIAYPLQGIRFKIHTLPFEELRINKRFDLIHLTHCLYYIPDRAGAVLKALNMIVDHGIVLIFHQTPMGINQIQRRFLKRAKGTEKEMFCSKELQDSLDRHHIKYRLNIIDSFMDISDCLIADSETSHKLISFFLECDTRQLLPEIRQEICQFIKELSCNDQGHSLVFHPVALFSLSKANREG